MSRAIGAVGAAIAAAVFALFATSGRVWDLFDRGPYTADFYDVQGRAIGRGGLSVPAEVAGIEGFRIGDETHLYFGIAPALARLPVVVWSDWLDGRLGLLSMTIAVAVGAVATARLAMRAVDATADAGWEAPAWLPDAAAAAFGLATPILWLGSRSIVYHEAELWGAALALAGCERALAWWESRTPRSLAVAGTIAVLAVHTRASSGLAPMLVILGFGALLLWRERSWRPAAAPIAIAVGAVATYAAINAARFGSPFSIPFDQQVFTAGSADRQAMLEATGGSFFSVRFPPTTLLQYLRPDAVRPDSLFPFTTWGPRATIVGDVPFDTVDRAGSVTTTMPLLLIAAAGIRPRRLDATWWIVIGACAVAALPTIAIGFIAHRYLVDFVPLLVVLGALGVPRVLSWRVGRPLLAVGATLGLLASIGLGILARNVYLLPEEGTTASFVERRYAIHDWYGGDPPPDVERRSSLDGAGPEGLTVVVGDCDGLYVGTGDGWQRAEVRVGGAFAAELTGRAERGLVIAGDGWDVGFVRTGDGLTLVYTAGAEVVRSGPLELVEGEETTVAVLTDVNTLGVEVRLDGAEEPTLSAFLLPAGGPLRPAPGWTSLRGDAPVCRPLAERLDD